MYIYIYVIGDLIRVVRAPPPLMHPLREVVLQIVEARLVHVQRGPAITFLLRFQPMSTSVVDRHTSKHVVTVASSLNLFPKFLSHRQCCAGIHVPDRAIIGACSVLILLSAHVRHRAFRIRSGVPFYICGGSGVGNTINSDL